MSSTSLPVVTECDRCPGDATRQSGVSVWTDDDIVVVEGEGEEDFAPSESVFKTTAGVFEASLGSISTSGLVVGDAA